MNKKLIVVSSLAALALPFMAFAAGLTVLQPGSVPPNTTLAGLITIIFQSFVWPIIGVAVTFFFILAAFEFFTAGGDATKVAGARQHLVYAIVALVVLLLSLSIPFIINNTLNLGGVTQHTCVNAADCAGLPGTGTCGPAGLCIAP